MHTRYELQLSSQAECTRFTRPRYAPGRLRACTRSSLLLRLLSTWLAPVHPGPKQTHKRVRQMYV